MIKDQGLFLLMRILSILVTFLLDDVWCCWEKSDVSHFWKCFKLKLYFAIGRSSTKSAKPAKLPVTPSTATLTKSQKTKTKKTPEKKEKKVSKQASPVKSTISSTSAPSSQVFCFTICSCKLYLCSLASLMGVGVMLDIPGQ